MYLVHLYPAMVSVSEVLVTLGLDSEAAVSALGSSGNLYAFLLV